MPHQIAVYLTSINFPFLMLLNKLRTAAAQRNVAIMLIVFVVLIFVITLFAITSYHERLYGCAEGYHLIWFGVHTTCVPD